MEETEDKSRKAGFPFRSVVLSLLIVLVLGIVVCGVLTLFGPTIGMRQQLATHPCATILAEHNEDVTSQPDFTITMTDDASGKVLYHGPAAGCRLPSNSKSVTLTLATTSSAWQLNQSTATVDPSFVCDSGCYFPSFQVAKAQP